MANSPLGISPKVSYYKRLLISSLEGSKIDSALPAEFKLRFPGPSIKVRPHRGTVSGLGTGLGKGLFVGCQLQLLTYVEGVELL